MALAWFCGMFQCYKSSGKRLDNYAKPPFLLGTPIAVMIHKQNQHQYKSYQAYPKIRNQKHLVYPPVLKHGVLENEPFISDFSHNTSVHRDFNLCLIPKG